MLGDLLSWAPYATFSTIQTLDVDFDDIIGSCNDGRLYGEVFMSVERTNWWVAGHNISK